MTLDQYDWTWPTRPSSEAEFDSMMWSLDGYLAARGWMPFQRPLQGAALVSSRLGFSGTTLFGKRGAGIAPFSGLDTLARVSDWFEDIYGPRLWMDLSGMRMVVHIRSTPWRLDLPITFGDVRFFAHSDLSNGGKKLGTVDEAASHNVLTSLHQASPGLVSSLSVYDTVYLLEAAHLGRHALPVLSRLPEGELARSAQADYKLSVVALLDTRTSGHAEWATAQTAEKAFKSILRSRGIPYPQGRDGHVIPKLGQILIDNGLAELDGAQLSRVDCFPTMRYGEGESTPASALASHYALLRLLQSLSGCCPDNRKPR